MLAIAPQLFQAVTPNGRQIVQPLGGVDHGQFSWRPSREGLELLHALAIEKTLRGIRTERLDHMLRV
jgi:hypothetical protein